MFSGVRIGEERRNVRGEGSYWRDESIFRRANFCQEYFCTFFNLAPRLLVLYAPFSLYFRPVLPVVSRHPHEPLCPSPDSPLHLVITFLCSLISPARPGTLALHYLFFI